MTTCPKWTKVTENRFKFTYFCDCHKPRSQAKRVPKQMIEYRDAYIKHGLLGLIRTMSDKTKRSMVDCLEEAKEITKLKTYYRN